MRERPEELLRRLGERLGAYGPDAAGAGPAGEKIELLEKLRRACLPRPGEVLRLHEALCFLRAYPDSADVLSLVERMLSEFAGRPDLRRHREELGDSGMAGTAIRYSFFWPTARWLAERFGSELSIDWDRFEETELLRTRLPLLMHDAETAGLEEVPPPVRRWVERMKGRGETDAAFLIRRLQKLPMNALTRERFYEELSLPLRLSPGASTPSRTRARFAPLASPGELHFQTAPLKTARPVLSRAIRERPLSVRPVPTRQGRVLIDLAREAMLTRSRDLDAFAYGDPADVRLVDWGEGLQFACIGQVPERRAALEAVYGFLTLKNGIPVGYVLASGLFGSSEVAYNIFETYRGREAAPIYGRVLATVRLLFGSDAFTIYPYQLGHHNEEGLRSGAWWFYRKMGFAPRDPGVRRILEAEEERMRLDPAHRSGRSVLKKLAAANLYYHLGRPREDVIGVLPLANLGLRVTQFLAGRFGADRELAERVCSREAARRFGLRAAARLSPGERWAWRLWAPILLILPGTERWSAGERRQACEVVRAKGGRRESGFVALFNRHRRLREAIRELAAEEPRGSPAS